MIAVADPKQKRRSMPSGQQKLAMSLDKAGYSFAQIGERLGISRQSAFELVARGRVAVDAFRREMADFLESN